MLTRLACGIQIAIAERLVVAETWYGGAVSQETASLHVASDVQPNCKNEALHVKKST